MTPAVARLRVLAACLLLTALSFSQSPSRVVPDTKLDLVVDPVRFLSRALHLWEPEGAFGQLQNQAYGYLFPMGPFFALGRLLELPGWVVQRAWLAAILVVALLGTVRLAERMGIGSDGTRLLAGLAYALSPRVLSVAGPISIEALPLAVLPWVLLPLVTGAQGGSERRAAARSGLAVLCIGGVNAAATLAVLPLPALFLLLRLGTPRGRRLAAWWAGAVTLAGLWWALPLLLLGRYSLPFLDFIETAEVTTAHTSLVEVLRGTSDWLAYLSVAGEPWWRAAHQLVTQPVLILQTAVLAALGLAGLLRRDAPHRSLLLGGVLLGTSLVTLGHVGDLPGWATPPLGAPVRELLDGALAPFRNVHKFDAVLRLPLVLGLAHLAASLRVPTPAVPPVGPAVRPLLARASGLLATPVVVAAVLALTATAAPALTGKLMLEGGFRALPEAEHVAEPSGPRVLPDWWQETASWLAEASPSGRALVVPGAAFGEYQWGRPLDEPLQALARAPWAVRNAIPLGSLGNTRLLDAIEARLEAGQGSAGLAAALRRAGVTHVVARNDLDEVRTGAPRPVLVRQALQQSGLERKVDFGPETGPVEPSRTGVRDEGLDVALPAVEIWAVTGPAGPVTTYPVDGALRVSGGPESLLQLADRGLGDRASLLAGDAGSELATAAALTDGMRRRELDAGKVRGGYSPTLTPGEPLRLGRRARDLVVVPGEQHLTTARYLGVRDVRASSSASDPGSTFLSGAQHAPWSGVDGNVQTGWISGGTRATGEWLEIAFARPQDVRAVEVTPLVSDLLGARVAALRVSTDAGSRVHTLGRPRGDQAPTELLATTPGPTTRVRVTVQGVDPGPDRLPDRLAGLRELVVKVAAAGAADPPWRGLPVERTLELPADGADAPAPAVIALDRTVGQRPGCVALRALPVADPAGAVTDKRVPEPGGGPARPTPRGSAAPPAAPSADPDRAALGRDRTLCAGGLPRAGEEAGALDRSFTTTGPLTGPVAVTVRPVPGEGLDRLLQATDDNRPGLLRVAARRAPDAPRSQRVPDPRSSDRMLYDGDPDTGWTSGTDPTLTLDLGAVRSVDSLWLVGDRRLAGAAPRAVVVRGAADGWQRRVTVRPDGSVPLVPAVRAQRLTLSFERRGDVDARASEDPALRVRTLLPLALAEVGASFRGVPVAKPAPAAGATVTLTCAPPGPGQPLARQGPVVLVNQQPVRLHGALTRRALLDLAPVTLTSCAALTLPAGPDHRLVAPTDTALGLRVDAVTLGSAASPAAPQRAVARTLAWGPTTRRLEVTAGPATYLAVRENANPGWEATLDGRPLRSVRLDGWQQGYLLPDGAAGTVRLVYAPDRLFRAGLGAGLGAALLLLGLVLVPGRPSRRDPAEPVAPGPVLAGAGAVTVVLLGGLAALPALALAGLLRRSRLLPVLGGGALVLGGALVAGAPWGGTRAPGADALLPQLLALVALAAVAVALVPARAARGASSAAGGSGAGSAQPAVHGPQ